MIKTVGYFIDGTSERINFFSNDYFVDSSIIAFRLSSLQAELTSLFGQEGQVIRGQGENGFKYWIQRKKEELTEFYAHKGIVVIIGDIYPIIRYLDSSGRPNINLDLLRLLSTGELALSYEQNTGKEFIFNPSIQSVIQDGEVQFAFTFSNAGSGTKTLATTVKSKKAVSFLAEIDTGHLIMFPDLYFASDDNSKLENKFFEQVKKLINSQKGDLETIVASPPDWVKEFDLPKHKVHEDSLTSLEKNKQVIENKIKQEQQSLLNYNIFKSILYTSGPHLERAVGKCFGHLGISHSYPDGSDTDMVIQGDNLLFAVEIKGVSGSASKQYVRQLEDWVNKCAVNYNLEDVKGLLIINAFNSKPVSQRTDLVFPPNVVEYSVPRGHCLLTTTTLLNILKDFDEGKITKDEILHLLNSTVGVLEYGGTITKGKK